MKEATREGGKRMAAPPRGNNFPAAGGEMPSAAQKMYLLVYHSCIMYQLRVLDFEISQLETASSFSGLLDEVQSVSDGFPSSGLLDEILRARDKRDRIYRELEQNQQRLEDLDKSDAVNEVGSPTSANSAT